jgi:hypothetical protein
VYLSARHNLAAGNSTAYANLSAGVDHKGHKGTSVQDIPRSLQPRVPDDSLLYVLARYPMICTASASRLEKTRDGIGHGTSTLPRGLSVSIIISVVYELNSRYDLPIYIDCITLYPFNFITYSLKCLRC